MEEDEDEDDDDTNHQAIQLVSPLGNTNALPMDTGPGPGLIISGLLSIELSTASVSSLRKLEVEECVG